jgi:hypothetical protein
MAIQDTMDVGAPQRRRYSLLELIKCAEREVVQRKRVYPRLVQDQRMSRAFADAEIARMQAIADALMKLAAAEGWNV